MLDFCLKFIGHSKSHDRFYGGHKKGINYCWAGRFFTIINDHNFAQNFDGGKSDEF